METQVTLITGTRKGIGKFLAEHYVRKGHEVIGCSRAKPEWALEHYRHFETDVADEKAVRAMFSAVRKDYGRLDHLINNAGIASMNHSLLTPVATVQSILSTNVVGTFLFCREAAKLMQPRRWGRIINFTTVATPLKSRVVGWPCGKARNARGVRSRSRYGKYVPLGSSPTWVAFFSSSRRP